jgi:hypothetical protein
VNAIVDRVANGDKALVPRGCKAAASADVHALVEVFLRENVAGFRKDMDPYDMQQ